jgi:hypothetical protein
VGNASVLMSALSASLVFMAATARMPVCFLKVGSRCLFVLIVYNNIIIILKLDLMRYLIAVFLLRLRLYGW